MADRERLVSNWPAMAVCFRCNVQGHEATVFS
jgi:hypothetical protein